jgi:phosphopantothenoylcysteine synthetase/decarboxylase
MNDVNAGFGFDTNKITIIKSDFTRKEFQLKSKREVAVDIVSEIENILLEANSRHTTTYDQRVNRQKVF